MAANLFNDNLEIWILLWTDRIVQQTELVWTSRCPVTQEWAHPWLDERSSHWCHPLIHNRADNDKPKPLTMMADSQHVWGWRRTSSSLSSGSKLPALLSRASGTSPENHKQQRALSEPRRDACQFVRFVCFLRVLCVSYVSQMSRLLHSQPQICSGSSRNLANSDSLK